jgi:uridylate kinase
MHTIVISIGGSVFLKGAEYIMKIARIIDGAAKENRIAVTVGGGRVAREYIQIGRELGADNTTLDELGIYVTRINARLLMLALPSAYPRIASSVEEAYEFFSLRGLVVMGGTTPGHTTDAVSAMLAEKLRAQILINVTNVDGLYEADPKTHPDAKKINHCTYDDLINILTKSEMEAGTNNIFDLLGAKILKRAGIKLIILNGEKLDVFQDALQLKPSDGRWSEVYD